MKLLNIDSNSSKPPLLLVSLTILAVIIIEFASPRAGTMVEGSLSTVINNSEPQLGITTNAATNYSPFAQGINSPKMNYASRSIIVTAYSSTPDQTDNTPFITASGQRVHDGIIASNFLPFGTKVQFPYIFGDKIFQVEDRMHKKYNNSRVDIWFPDRASAQLFGIKKTTMRILK